jgi:hypothetical protein
MFDYIDMRLLRPQLQSFVDYHPGHAMDKSGPVTYKPHAARTGLASESLPEEPLEWLRECRAHDDLCSEMNKPLGQSSFLPSRLLDLGPITTRHLPQGPTQKLHLIDTRQTAIGDSNYVALSHRWASQNDPRLDLTTKSCTLQARMDGIETEKLSKTYRFAVDICHWLGVRYLWIDSFCIIQVGITLTITGSVKTKSLY